MAADRYRYSIMRLLKISLVLLICSIVLAVPVVYLTMQWSMNASYHLYGKVTRILNLHSPSISQVDKDGVPINDLGYQKGDYIGSQRNPLTIATKAISYYDEFKKNGNICDKEYFTNCIKWLESAKTEKANYCLWAYNFSLPTYEIPAPWYSAMAQARIMITFEKAYELEKDDHYLQLAIKAMRALEVPINEGGVLYIDPENGGKWFEEVASKNQTIPPHILNGFIFSLLDLYNFYIQTESQEAKNLFEDGVTEVKLHISDYDTGRWTYYDLNRNFAYDYHYVHVDQMQKLYDITGDIVFKNTHDRWASYFPINPLWARERFAAYLFDFGLIFIGLTLVTFAYIIYRQKIGKNRK